MAACAGIIVFGSLMGAMFISQQFLQNVLGYSTLDAGAAFLPAVVCMVLVAPRSAKLVETRGARFTLLCGYVFLLLAFAWMLLLWKEGISYWKVGLAYAFMGIGVGFAGTPASHSLTGSVPVRRAGMASGTADLQRDLGGAIMQSIFGALLTAGYATAVGGGDRGLAEQRADQRQRPERADEVVRRRRGGRASSTRSTPRRSPPRPSRSFLDGDQWAYIAGIVAVLLGAALVFFMFPKHEEELRLLERYHAEDTAGNPTPETAPAVPA